METRIREYSKSNHAATSKQRLSLINQIIFNIRSGTIYLPNDQQSSLRHPTVKKFGQNVELMIDMLQPVDADILHQYCSVQTFQ